VSEAVNIQIGPLNADPNMMTSKNLTGLSSQFCDPMSNMALVSAAKGCSIYFLILYLLILFIIAPSPVYSAAPIHLSLFKEDLSLPLLHIRRINKPARLNAEPAPGSSSRHSIHSRDIDILPGVKLESRVGAVDLEMDAAARMVGGDEVFEGPGARVDGAGVRRRVEDEAVVYVGLGDAEGEGLARADAGVVCWEPGWDAAFVDGEIEACAEGDIGVCNCGLAGEVEVPRYQVSWLWPVEESGTYE
jgi:hypothetical protein